jgi:hypothetical protein
MMILIGAVIAVCFTLIGLSIWGVMTKKYDGGDSLEKIQHLSDIAMELTETGEIYQKIGMEKEAQEAFDEAARLNTMVWEVINGANH